MVQRKMNMRLLYPVRILQNRWSANVRFTETRRRPRLVHP
jgi:hypothetical protein